MSNKDKSDDILVKFADVTKQYRLPCFFPNLTIDMQFKDSILNLSQQGAWKLRIIGS